MILSDISLREAIAAGRIGIDPFDDAFIQPSSIDVRVDAMFRVFRNHTAGFIDVKLDMGDLTEVVEIPNGGVFMLHPGEFVLGSTLERVRVANDLVARIEGKALSIATPIPTPNGWATMGDLGVGDFVFDLSGEPVRIKDATAVMFGRPCWEVTFSDGTTIIADEAHQWMTTTKARRGRHAPPSIKSTGLIARSLRYGCEYNHHIPLARSVRCPPVELPIDPYVLGIWLGDGTSASAEITTADDEILDEIRRAGYDVHPASSRLKWYIGGVGHTRDARTGRFAPNDSLSSTLRRVGVLGNKHIPPAYLRASIEQRQALLEGLMDSDGHCDTWGRCEFTTIKEHLALEVSELVASLGLRSVIAKKPAKLNGVDHGPKYDVTFTPDRKVFRLRRKLRRQKATGRFNRFRAIVAVRPVPSVPVRCIEIDGTDGVYLASRSFIPTHNSSLGRLGLLIHSTAGFVDPGWDGHITLELANVASLPITLYPGMKIGQLSFMQMTTPADVPYGHGKLGSKYQGQRGPTPSRYFENFRNDDG